MKFFEYHDFDYTGWDRPEHTVVRDPKLRNEIYTKGFSIVQGFVPKETIDELNRDYDSSHTIQTKNGGFFVSIYSKDIDYRRKVHDYILTKIGASLESIFQDFKYTCLNYAVKYPGAEGELFIHQDMAQVDESRFSQVGVWIPLVDVSLENGTLGIVPYTHFTIPPHRSLYHDLPYSKIYRKMHEYVQPLELKAGDMLLFDIRLMHNSFINRTDLPRKSLAASVVPKEAEFCMLYRDEQSPEGVYEMLKLADDFYMTFADFKSEKIDKPGISTGKMVTVKEAFVTEEEFERFCATHDLPKTDMDKALTFKSTHSIQEPVTQLPAEPKVGLFQRIKKALIN